MSAMPQLAPLEAQANDALAQLIEAGRRRLASLQSERDELDRQIAIEGRKVQAWEHARRSLAYPPPPLRVVAGQMPTKREAVLSFLAENPDSEFKLVEIRRGLIERGAMTNEQAHALEVAVRDMESRGEIRRVRKGIYTLRPRIEGEDS
jgi:hypothetical protein